MRGEEEYGSGAEDEQEHGSQEQSPYGEIPNLTQEEMQNLQPKKTKVVNPWIHEQTHQEYLENIIGLPARHANVIRKHKFVVKETMFLPKADSNFDKDKATKEALAILEKEYEIFNDANMPPVKALTRYDTWDQDRTPEAWLEHCAQHPDEYHGISPVFEKGEYLWRPVKVLDYNYAMKKFKVEVGDSGAVKHITRLSLLFYDEDPEAFRQRVNQCKQRQRNVEAELRFTSLVDSQPSDAVSLLSKERRESFLHKCQSENSAINPDFLLQQF